MGDTARNDLYIQKCGFYKYAASGGKSEGGVVYSLRQPSIQKDGRLIVFGAYTEEEALKEIQEWVDRGWTPPKV